MGDTIQTTESGGSPEERINQLTKQILPHQIGKEYVEKPTLPEENTAKVTQDYRLIAERNLSLFEEIPIEVEFTDTDPYGGFRDMCRQVAKDRKLKVYSGGSHGNMFSKEENLKGRAVHDFYGHYSNKFDFSWEGEAKVWDSIKCKYPERTYATLFAEIVGQVSAAYYLSEGFESPSFRQRAIRSPEGWLTATKTVLGLGEFYD